jgi:hypothetical protein
VSKGGGGGGFGKKSENKNTSARDEGRKRNRWFLDPAYTVRGAPPIFTDEATSPTNIRHIYLSMT